MFDLCDPRKGEFGSSNWTLGAQFGPQLSGIIGCQTGSDMQRLSDLESDLFGVSISGIYKWP